MEMLESQETRPAFMDALDKVSKLANINSQETDLVIVREKVEVLPLAGDEEQALKTGNITLSTFIKNFNKLLFSKLKLQENTQFKDYETFLKLLTPQDKALLIYAFSLSSFKKLGTVGKICEHCEQEFPVDIIPEELWHKDSAPKAWDKGENPFDYRVPQVFLDGALEIYFKLPTEFDRIRLMDMLENNIKDNLETSGSTFSVLDTIAFFCDKIVIIDADGKGKNQELTDLTEEIFPFLHNLPAKIKDDVFDSVDLEIFDDYMPNLYQEAKCTRCHKNNKVIVNIETEFFRKAVLLFG